MKIHILISGRVQMVGFRFFTRMHAKKLNLSGFIKNLSNGKVEALFIGKKENINKILELCKKGPLFAKVTNIEILKDNPEFDNEEFEVLF
ncbi:MAG: acylphosphatase [Candidatus Nanoarchaeia archaeon]|nr:acylphosphatase [Candidatus Nanoarchaeia archaeon]